MGKIRGIHSSPGIYTKFTDISYAAKTLGVTTLGLAGETLKGPAFEPIPISSWTEYIQYFGGTSPAKFEGSKYPKYELPYIAKEYLSVSDQLYVCRVLGLSGYNAGPAFVICAMKKNSGDPKRVIAVLRSRGYYKKYPMVTSDCALDGEYDSLKFLVTGVTIETYKKTTLDKNGCNDDFDTDEYGYDIDVNNYGRFTIVCNGITETGDAFSAKYPVSLNVEDKDYIYNVLGSDPLVDGAPVYVEELYDVMLAEGIKSGEFDIISENVATYKPLKISAVTDPVSDFVTVDYDSLSRKQYGYTFLYSSSTAGEQASQAEDKGFKYLVCDNEGNIQLNGGELPFSGMEVGGIYVVTTFNNPKNSNKKEYAYVALKLPTGGGTGGAGPIDCKVGKYTPGTTEDTVSAVKVLSRNKYYCLDNSGNSVIEASDMSDYKEGFRSAQSPWIVSELKGNGLNIDVLKLFKFYTISDGNSSNAEIKISIANVSPDDGTFDVYIRDFNDTDGNIVVLESYKNLTMKKGDKNYIGYRIGTLNGEYEAKSKYVLVDIIENDMTEECVPCGFLGYPTRNYIPFTNESLKIKQPTFKYNITYDSNVSERKQYFGLSNLTGVDIDMLTYKGRYAYTDNYSIGHTDAFHLDSRISKAAQSGLTGITITVDSDKTTSGITWDAVAANMDNGLSGAIIGTDREMDGTIYESKAMRKFTFYMYGGFDGWDIYRPSRTNTDKFRANKYHGKIENGIGASFSVIDNPESLALSGNCITSDYYAYLAGAMQFENPEKVRINLFATPGIDYVNQGLLTNDILEMVEDVRGDSLYVMTTPDKPAAASDAVDEMFTPQDAAENLEDSNIDTYYAATYYPWVKYFDRDNLIYVNLPVTKDVLRNMADVDNKKYPWYAPAGIERGNVNCVKARLFSKLEDEDTLYDGRINPVKTFSRDGVKIWGNKTLYTGDTPMNRVNVVRLMLYMRKLIIEACRGLIFEPNEATLKGEFEGIVRPILEQIQKDRGITAFRLDVSQTQEQIDAHEMSCVLWVKPTPALEYIEINFMITPQGVEFDAV